MAIYLARRWDSAGLKPHAVELRILTPTSVAIEKMIMLHLMYTNQTQRARRQSLSKEQLAITQCHAKGEDEVDADAVPSCSGLTDIQQTNLSAERTHIQRTNTHRANEHISSERTHIERTHIERTHIERTHIERTHIERTHIERTHIERTHIERTHIERTHIERTHIGRVITASRTNKHNSVEQYALTER